MCKIACQGDYTERNHGRGCDETDLSDSAQRERGTKLGMKYVCAKP